MIKKGIVALLLLALAVSVSQGQHLLQGDEPGDREIVVLLHGLARNNAAMWLLNLRLQKAGFFVEAVGYESFNVTTDDMIESISTQIDACCKSRQNRVHFVGHSLGGLLVRAYLQDNRIGNLGRVVLMGTPNQGTEVADYLRDKWWAQLAGPAPLALGTGDDSFPRSLDDPYYPVGVIAGLREGEANDDIIPGADDGLVSIESTRLAHMTDFVVIETGHTMMRYSEAVATQTIHFLRHGRFQGSISN